MKLLHINCTTPQIKLWHTFNIKLNGSEVHHRPSLSQHVRFLIYKNHLCSSSMHDAASADTDRMIEQ
jgi:hypothetical protein